MATLAGAEQAVLREQALRSLFASLALQPTAAIGVNHTLQLPKWRFRSNAPPSAFAYPPASDKKKEACQQAPTASAEAWAAPPLRDMDM